MSFFYIYQLIFLKRILYHFSAIFCILFHNKLVFIIVLINYDSDTYLKKSKIFMKMKNIFIIY